MVSIVLFCSILLIITDLFYSSSISTIGSNIGFWTCFREYSAPTETPSWAPTITEVLEFVAYGFCLDDKGDRFGFFQLDSAPNPTDYDEYCKNWCLQNDESNFVGVQTGVEEGLAKCRCLFAKPDGFGRVNKASYNPPADSANNGLQGEGEVQDRTYNTHTLEVDYNLKCFRKKVGSHV